MKRKSVIELLTAYMPHASEEQQYKIDMLNFIQKYENCFERSLEIGHITASAWLLNRDQTHALLMHHAKLNMWVQLGGHCDGDSDVRAVALKEAQEESGIQDIVFVSSDIFDIDIHLIPENKKEREHYHYDIRFLLKVAGNEQVRNNHESKELRWIRRERSLLPTTERSVVRMFEKWCAL